MRIKDAETLARMRCDDPAPATFSGHWREWHRGHGCNLDPVDALAASGDAQKAGEVPTAASVLDRERATWLAGLKRTAQTKEYLRCLARAYLLAPAETGPHQWRTEEELLYAALLSACRREGYSANEVLGWLIS